MAEQEYGVCPFCGAGADELDYYETLDYPDGDGETSQNATCMHCGCGFETFLKIEFVRQEVTQPGDTLVIFDR